MSRKAEATKNHELEKSKQLINKAFRQNQGIIEKMICQHLLQATFSTDLKTVIPHVCASARKFKVLHPESKAVDFELLKAIQIMLDSLNRAIDYRSYAEDNFQWTFGYRVSWGFEKNQENYDRFIHSWIIPLNYISKEITKHLKNATKLTHRRYFGRFEERKIDCPRPLEFVDPHKKDKAAKKWIGQKCPFCGQKIGEYEITTETGNFINEEPSWSFFFEVTEHLTKVGYNLLIESFTGWALNQCHDAAAQIGSKVSEKIFDAERQFFVNKKEELEEN